MSCCRIELSWVFDATKLIVIDSQGMRRWLEREV